VFKETMAAGAIKEIPASGNFIHVINGPVRIRTVVKSGLNRIYPELPTGYGVETEEFDGFEITNLAGVETEVKIYFGYGRFRQGADGSIVEVAGTVDTVLQQPIEIAADQYVTVTGLEIPSNVTFTAPVPIAPDTGVTGLAPITLDVTETDTIAASVLRSGLLLSADAANVDPIWIGHATAGNGVPLQPGDSLPLHTEGAVIISGTEGDKVYLLETLK